MRFASRRRWVMHRWSASFVSGCVLWRSPTCKSAGRPFGVGCIGRSWCGVGLVRWWVPKTPNGRRSSENCENWLRNLPPDEIAVFQDEVDVNTNPKIGSMWMRCGQQAEVETPGTNEKRYLAGSLNWRTGDLILTEEPRAKDATRPCLSTISRNCGPGCDVTARFT